MFKENVAYKADRVKFKHHDNKKLMKGKERKKEQRTHTNIYQSVIISTQIHVKQLYTVKWKTQKLRLLN